MELKIHAGSADPAFLDGKYSESFVSELSRQITHAIEDAMGISGLDGSTLRLELVFAPGTYMEHTSDNVTYRRLLLSDKSCQARDFWVKWTRLDGAVAYTVSDDVTEDSIKFELGEDVPQKIREREFRFLCSKNPDKYQSAMGKKTVTEWRELIKRAIRRGDVVKLESELSELARDENSVQDKLLEVLSSFGRAVEVEEEKREENTASSFDSIMELARAALDRESTKEEAEDAAPENTDGEDGLPWLTLDEEDGADNADAPEPEWAEELLPEDEDADGEEPDEYSEDYSEEPEHCEPLSEEPEAEEPECEKIEAEEPEAEAEEAEEESFPEEDIEDVPEAPSVPSEEEIRREIEERVRRELEEKLRIEYEAKIRLEYEERERDKLAEAARREREETEKLRRDNERLAELARLAEAERAREEAERLALIERKAREEEELRLRLAREELMAKERDRLAEAARRAVVEERERELLSRTKTEIPEAPKPILREPEPELVGYIAKHARLMFKGQIDLNVIPRIKEIIENTLISENKLDIPLRMKAYPVDGTTIGLDILRIPESEKQLLVTMMKALGNAGLGIVKITVE